MMHDSNVSMIEPLHAIDDDKAASEALLPQEEGVEGSYVSLLRKNRPFRLFLSSYLITLAGEWFTYVASITMIENFLGNGGTSPKTAISVLVVVRLIPNVALSALGGALADARDRRESMVALDVVGAAVALLYLVAFRLESVLLVYIVTCAQQCVSALYEPCRSAMVPLLVSSEEDLKRATTLTVLAWSVMAAAGAALGGVFVTWVGIRMCFVIDSATYMASAYLMYQVGGKWNVADSHDKVYESVWEQVRGMTVDGARYIRGSSFGGIVFLKASAAILFGASDVLNVSFSERGGMDKSSERLGVLFALSGVGCMMGPLLVDQIRGPKPSPNFLQVACIGSLMGITAGYLGMGLTHQFGYTCLFSGIRAMGSSVLWIDSSLILQVGCAMLDKRERQSSILTSFRALVTGIFVTENAWTYNGTRLRTRHLVRSCIGPSVWNVARRVESVCRAGQLGHDGPRSGRFDRLDCVPSPWIWSCWRHGRTVYHSR